MYIYLYVKEIYIIFIIKNEFLEVKLNKNHLSKLSWILINYKNIYNKYKAKCNILLI
jgi:hypothetical protein